MEYSNVSILMPSYNRRKFLPLITNNLLNMDYDKNKLEWCILDDGVEPLFTDETLKQTRKLTKEKTIEVKNDGGVKLNSIDKDGSIDKTITNTINDPQSFEDIIETILGYEIVDETDMVDDMQILAKKISSNGGNDL